MPNEGLPDHGREASDEALMARYADGDAAAFAELFGRYERRVYRYFLRRTRSPARAEDLYQELFLRVHRARDRYDASRPFAPWLFQIARRLWLDDASRSYRSREISLAQRDPCVGSPSSEERLADRETIGRALGALPNEERDVLLAAKLDGVGYGELAVQLGKSALAVRKVASRAMQRLRSMPDFAS